MIGSHSRRLVLRSPSGRARMLGRALVSRAQRSMKWCAADTDLGFTRDRRLNVRKSGKPDLRGPFKSVAVPDPRGTAPLPFALHRIPGTFNLAPLRFPRDDIVARDLAPSRRLNQASLPPR